MYIELCFPKDEYCHPLCINIWVLIFVNRVFKERILYFIHISVTKSEFRVRLNTFKAGLYFFYCDLFIQFLC